MEMVLYTFATFILFLAVSNSLEPGRAEAVPQFNDKTYSNIGDINIGAIVFVIEDSMSQPAETCSGKAKLSNFALESTETIAFAVELINQSPYLLPNVTLGHTIGGICMSPGVALKTSFAFLPLSPHSSDNVTCSDVSKMASDCSMVSHDVVAMVGFGYSSYTTPVSSLYAVGHLPIIGPTETSDDLSNKRTHPYFFRMVPPDMYQVQAMLRFISSKGWSYISVIYEDGTYGQRAYDRLHQHVGQYGICIATSHRLIHPPNYSDVVTDLLMNYKARVVVLFVWPEFFKEVLQAVVDQNATGHFIWIGADALFLYAGYDYKGVTQDPAIGTFTFDFHTTHVPAYFDYIKQQRVSTTKNPWMKEVWEYLFDCSYDEGTCDLNANILQSKKYHTFKETSLRIDAVLTIAHALHDLISVRCPNARGEKARACVTGELLREYMKNASFEGFTGDIRFDKNQDIKGKYLINQLDQDYPKHPFSVDTTTIGTKTLVRKQVGVYDISTDSISYVNEIISWAHITTSDIFVDLTHDLNATKFPESKCSIPCSVGEYKIQKELPCCWECRKCRENEHLVKDNTTCEKCPSFMWPDPDSGFTSCKDIPLTYPMFNDPIPIVFTSLALLALVVTLFIIVSYFIYRNERVIKASSRELSVIQLFAIFTGYTTVILFQTKPSDVMCGVIFFLFCMSFVLLYSPLLVKTVRICRIFKSGSKNQQPRFISPGSQLFFAKCLIAIQAALCATVYILFNPKARRTQPIWSEKLVELSCDLTFPGIASFLVYNIILVSLCSVFAFMVRKLPDNFNESKFISMCVTTTLLIWLAFIPAYFTADREFVRVFLLSVGLFLNHSVALIFLFIPKMYAAKYLSPEAGDFSKNRS